MIDLTNPGNWRMRIWVRGALYALLALLALVGLLPLPLWESLALLAGAAVLFGLYLAGRLDPERWMNTLNPLVDMGLLFLLIRHGGASPWSGFAYVWLAGNTLVNFRNGRAGPLPGFVLLVWAVLALARLGQPDWLLFAIGHALGLFLMSLVLAGFLREREDGRLDPLTGALDRRAGREELARLAESLDGFNLAFVDMRGFKAINDDHGHAVGDEVLRAVVGRLGNAVREADVVIRYGGDEFVVASPLENLAARLGEVMKAPVGTSAGPIRVHADLGVMPWSRGGSLDELLARADEIMYARKRVESGQPEPGRSETGRSGGVRST